MKIPDKLAKYYVCLKKGDKITIRDEQTKLYIKAKETIWVITVDRGIISNLTQKIRKCDYLVYGEAEKNTHLIELKGSVIDEAYKQLNATIENIASNKEISYLIEGRNKLDAYIVSLNTQKIPKGINSHERELAKKLAQRCKHKPSDIMNLINYVKVVPRQTKLVKERQRILCSGQAPLELE